jgi:hypothetical protein
VRTQVRYYFKCLDVFMNTYNSNPNADVSSSSQQPYFAAGSALYSELWQANALEAAMSAAFKDAMDAAERARHANPTWSASEYSFSVMG